MFIAGSGTGSGGLLQQLLKTLQQAEQLLSSQCNLVDDLREQLAEVQGGHAAALQKLGSVPESQLAAMQQQHTADMLQAVAQFMRHGVEHGAHHASDPEDGLAAMQRRHTVNLINGLTQYLQRDVQQMQQMCELIAAKCLPYRRRKDF
ncbi:hypothetical protein ABBQ32_004943 [Trebouxia sp. C0010 RCD-2024]